MGNIQTATQAMYEAQIFWDGDHRNLYQWSEATNNNVIKFKVICQKVHAYQIDTVV